MAVTVIVEGNYRFFALYALARKQPGLPRSTRSHGRDLGLPDARARQSHRATSGPHLWDSLWFGALNLIVDPYFAVGKPRRTHAVTSGFHVEPLALP
jgi:hypothetical protein